MSEVQQLGRLVRALRQEDIRPKKRPRQLKTGGDYFKKQTFNGGWFRQIENQAERRSYVQK